MKHLLEDILRLEDVEGILLFSTQGDLIAGPLVSSGEIPYEVDSWKALIESLGAVREVESVFEAKKVYLRRIENVGYLMVIMGIFSSTSMVRLQCDLIVPQLQKLSPTQGRRGLFRRRR